MKGGGGGKGGVFSKDVRLCVLGEGRDCLHYAFECMFTGLYSMRIDLFFSVTDTNQNTQEVKI